MHVNDRLVIMKVTSGGDWNPGGGERVWMSGNESSYLLFEDYNSVER